MTKASLIAHACWAAIAAGAFVAGSMRDKGESSGGDAGSAERGGARGSGGTSGLPSRSERAAGLRSGSGPAGERAAGSQAASPLSEEQLAALAQEAFRNGNPVARRMAFGKLLEALTADNATSILALLKENRADDEEWRDFHYAWGSMDGNAAVKHAMESKEYDMAHTMAGWASANPDEARRFLDNLPGDIKTNRELLKRSLVEGIADRDPALATNLVYSLETQGDRNAGDYMNIVTGEVLRAMNPQEAAQWSETLPDGSLKGAAMDRVAHSLVARDPVAAAEWAERFAGEEYAGRVIEEVGDEWAERDPAAAVNWLESLPEGDGQRMGLSSAYGEWSRRDPVASGERIAAMPRSPQRDAAISGYVGSLSYRDPVTAIEWANSIADNNLRNRSLTRAGQMLFRRDADAARQWVTTSGLPPEAQEQILNPPRRR